MRLAETFRLRTCPTDEQLAAFLDGGLGGPERQQVLTHLADCECCRPLLAAAAELEPWAMRVDPDRVPDAQRPVARRVRQHDADAWEVCVTGVIGLLRPRRRRFTHH